MSAKREMRISVTALDEWWYYRTGLSYATGEHALSLEAFVRRLRRLDPPTPALRRGTLLHRHLETEGRDAEAAEFIRFDCDVEIERPAVREMRVLKEYRLSPSLTVTLSGRIDGLLGRTVVDYKGSSRAPSYASYDDISGAPVEGGAHPWQWRCYLDMLPDCDRHRFECFTMYDPRRGEHAWRVVRHERFTMERYQALGRDVARALSDYVEMLFGLERAGLVRLGPRGVVTD